MRKIIIPFIVVSSIAAAFYAVMPHGTIAEILLAIQAQQRLFRETIGTDLRAIKDTHSFAATLSLMTAGFLYGVFHAIGPGHGKVIVASYMLANDTTLKKGIVITILSSLMQAIVAIVLVVGLFEIIGLQRTQTEQAAEYLDIASFALIFLVGGILFKRGITPLLKRTHHHHHHEHHEGCNHSHTPDSKTLETATTSRQLWLMIFSIGIRPCTGAIILLLFACIVGIIWAGVLATLAMSVGTALSTGIVAIAAMHSKTWTLRLLKNSPNRLLKVQACFSVVGGGVLMLMAGLLLAASFTAPLERGGNPFDAHPVMRQQGSTK